MKWEFISQIILTWLPLIVAIISMIIAWKASRINKKYAEEVHQPEFFIKQIKNKEETSKLYISIENTGHKIYTIKKVRWTGEKVFPIDFYNGELTRSNSKQGVYERTYVTILDVDLESITDEDNGKFAIDYIDVHGKKVTVYTPRIILTAKGVQNPFHVKETYLTKFN